MAHARRKFFELHAANHSTVAAEALQRIAELYEIEGRARTLGAQHSANNCVLKKQNPSSKRCTTGCSRLAKHGIPSSFVGMIGCHCAIPTRQCLLLRTQRGLSQGDLAGPLTQANVSSLELAKSSAIVDMSVQIAEALKVEPSPCSHSLLHLMRTSQCVRLFWLFWLFWLLWPRPRPCD